MNHKEELINKHIEEPVRVLQIVTCMNRSGLETMIMNYYRNIDRSKIQFDFLEHRLERSDYDDEIESLGGRIYRILPINPFSVKYRKELSLFFLEHKYHIVHSHMNCMSSLPLTYAKKNAVEKCIAHSHSTNDKRNLKYFIKQYYKRKIPYLATDLCACGIKAGKWLYGEEADFRIIPNAINIEEFRYNEDERAKVRSELGIEGAFVIGNIGRFEKMKNHIFLIDVFEKILEMERGARLLLIGDGKELENIKRRVEEKKLKDQVFFYGKTNKVSSLLSAMDVFVLPSIYEGVPVTLVEARASGLKCVVSDTVATEERILMKGVKRLSLSTHSKVWAKEILKTKETYVRYPTDSDFNKEYDVAIQSQKLQNFYYRLYEETAVISK